MPDNIVNVDFRRHFHIQPGDWLLDLGCGNGRHSLEAARWPARVVGVDVVLDDLRKARYMLADLERKGQTQGVADFILADAQRLPFRDGVFDKVVCTETLEHVPDDRAAIREIDRVARPGAEICVSVPAYWPETLFWTLSWGYWHTPGGHVRRYRPGEMGSLLTQHGMRPHLERRRHAFQALYWFLRCTFGKDNEGALLPKLVFKFINWHHRLRVPILERIEATLNLVIGKDLILYARKAAVNGHAPASKTRGAIETASAEPAAEA